MLLRFLSVLAVSKWLFLPFFPAYGTGIDKKGNQKIKHGMIPPGIRACQRLHIALGASLLLSGWLG
jgi:hypothetical protein